MFANLKNPRKKSRGGVSSVSIADIDGDDDNDNGESYQVKTIGANVPYILSSEVGLASNGSVDGFNGTSDLIERINCKNSSG